MPHRIERESALPLDLFVDDAIFELELGEIWNQDWVFATTVDAVAEPGDYVPVTIGRQPIIVVRGADLSIRALANTCSHRGMPLVDAPGRASRFPCPYHAWTYGDDGQLLSVPYSSPDELCKSDHGLAEYRVAQWHGLVFVTLNDQAPELIERIAAIEPYVQPLALKRLYHDTAGVADEVWKANWKIIYANALDSYSHFRVHAETIEPTSPTDASYYLAGSAKATVTGGESGARADHLMIAIPPSFVAIAYPDSLLWQAFVPVSVNETRVLTGVAGEQQPPDDADSTQPINMPGWDAAFVDEDRAVCERLQAGATARFVPGPLLDIERSLGDFHEYLSWRLAGNEPEPPTIAAAPGDRP